MLIVDPEIEIVEQQLREGRLLCPECRGVLNPWAWARSRRIRGIHKAIRPRRARCSKCRTTHVLLPDTILVRKVDSAENVGACITLSSTGLGYRKISEALNIPESTTRRLLRTVKANAAELAAVLAHQRRQLDPLAPTTSSVNTGTSAIVTQLGAWINALLVRFGTKATIAPWRSFSRLTKGLFATRNFSASFCNTS
jgi:transposase-like protein